MYATTPLLASRKRKAESNQVWISSDEERCTKKPRLEDKMEEDGSSFESSENPSCDEENRMALETIDQTPFAPYLPPEILFKIFNSSKFDLEHLHNASCVCSSWNACLKDEAFSWRKLFEDRLLEDMYSGSADRFTVEQRHVQSKFNKRTTYKWMMTLYAGKKDIGMSDLNDYSPKFLSDLLESDIYTYELPNTAHEWRGNVRYYYHIRARINFYRLETQIRRGDKVPIDMLTAVLLRNLKVGPFMVFKIAESCTPEAPQLVTEAPADITGVQLHNYQIRAINWMVFTEREEKEYSISPLLSIGRANMYLYATSKSHEILCLDTPEQVRSYDLKFKPKGGVLADEMGLGKTVEVIGLIAANPRTDFTPDPTEKKRHQTKATLIICPNHLVAQWKSEIEKYCGKKMTVVVITTIVQVKKYTSQDIIDADVVLITYNLLGNNNYAKFKAEHMTLRPLSGKGVILHHFHWHRMVCDEGHEHGELPTFFSSYRWYMTGTPFPKASDMGRVRRYLAFTMDSIGAATEAHMGEFEPKWHQNMGSKYDQYVEDKLDKVLVDNLVWRNTKASIKEEYELVKTKPHYVLLDFTPLEQVIYQEKSSSYGFYDTPISFCNTFAVAGIELRLTSIFKKRKADLRTHVAQLEHSGNTSYSNSYYSREQLQSQKRLLELYESTKKPKSWKDAAENTLEWLIERYGTKTANLYLYLKDLFGKDDEARALIFSTDEKYLSLIREVLEARGIYTSTVKGNVHKKSKELKNFKNADSMVRVVLLNTTKVASGMNLIEASHVIFLDVASGSDGAAHESQAIGRAYRQGQTKHVTVVRFVIKDTKDFDAFVQRCPNYATEQSLKASSMLVRSSSSLH